MPIRLWVINDWEEMGAPAWSTMFRPEGGTKYEVMERQVQNSNWSEHFVSISFGRSKRLVRVRARAEVTAASLRPLYKAEYLWQCRRIKSGYAQLWAHPVCVCVCDGCFCLASKASERVRQKTAKGINICTNNERRSLRGLFSIHRKLSRARSFYLLH